MGSWKVVLIRKGPNFFCYCAQLEANSNHRIHYFNHDIEAPSQLLSLKHREDASQWESQAEFKWHFVVETNRSHHSSRYSSFLLHSSKSPEVSDTVVWLPACAIYLILLRGHSHPLLHQHSVEILGPKMLATLVPLIHQHTKVIFH